MSGLFEKTCGMTCSRHVSLHQWIWKWVLLDLMPSPMPGAVPWLGMHCFQLWQLGGVDISKMDTEEVAYAIDASGSRAVPVGEIAAAAKAFKTRHSSVLEHLAQRG